MSVFDDFCDFIEARLAEQDRTGGLGAKLLELHQPVLVTWHPTWFCSCCEGDDEPQHHMGMGGFTFTDEGVSESWVTNGPLMKAGAEWPCATLLALAAVYSDHPDHGHWIPGVRQRPSMIGTVYVLRGGPASDGRVRLRVDQPDYLDDPNLGPNDSTVQIRFPDKRAANDTSVIRLPEFNGSYVYRAAADTIEWEGSADD